MNKKLVSVSGVGPLPSLFIYTQKHFGAFYIYVLGYLELLLALLPKSLA